MGNRTQRTDLSGTHTYSYDPLDQLTATTHPAQPAESYSYDAVGNRTASHLSTTFTYQADNRLTATDSATYTYDANGNMITKMDGSGTWHYVWDYENRLIQVVRPDCLGIAFAYDALGRRVERSASTGEVIRYVWNLDNVIEEQDAAGNVLRRYVHTDQIDDLVSVEMGGNAYVYHQDGLHSVGHLTDMTGTVVDSYTTDSFGQTTGAPGTITQPYDFTGRYRDGDIGLMYYRNRWYDPELGRFLSEDPIGFEGEDVNLYRYVFNNPVNWIDPTGNFVSAAAIGAACVADAPACAGLILTTVLIVKQVCDNILHSERHSDEKEALIDMAKQDKRKGGMTAEDMETYKELNKELPDPFPENKVRGPEQHSNRPHGKNPHGHVGPVDHIPIK